LIKFNHFLTKTLSKRGIEGLYLNIINAIYSKPTASIIRNREKPRTFLLRSGTRQRHPHSPLFLYRLLEFLARAIRQEKEVKDIQIQKEEIKISLLADNMVLHTENTKDATKLL
jgi:hypothetical protein